MLASEKYTASNDGVGKQDELASLRGDQTLVEKVQGELRAEIIADPSLANTYHTEAGLHGSSPRATSRKIVEVAAMPSSKELTLLKEQREIKGMFPKLWEAVRRMHEQVGMQGSGHDFDHAQQVAHYAREIAPDDVTARLAMAAALCHNADRILQVKTGVGRKSIPKTVVSELFNKWLDSESGLRPDERELIVRAVLGHDGPNNSNDSDVQVVLMDADRCSNLAPSVILRSAQFYRDLPLIDPIHLLSDPEATFHEPRSILRDLWNNLNGWYITTNGPFSIRTPQARAVARPHAEFLKKFMITIVKEYAPDAVLEL